MQPPEAQWAAPYPSLTERPRNALFDPADLRPAAVTGGLVAISGVLWGLLWWLFAPTINVRITGDGALISEDQQEKYLGSDVAFLGALCVGAFLTVAGVWWFARKWRGPTMLVAMAVGLVASAAIARGVGEEIGERKLAQVQELAEAGSQSAQLASFPVLDLGLQGLLFVPALLATAAYMLMVAWARDRGDGMADREILDGSF